VLYRKLKPFAAFAQVTCTSLLGHQVPPAPRNGGFAFKCRRALTCTTISVYATPIGVNTKENGVR